MKPKERQPDDQGTPRGGGGDQGSTQAESPDRPSDHEQLPMSGVRVIDVGTFLAGPYAASRAVSRWHMP